MGGTIKHQSSDHHRQWRASVFAGGDIRSIYQLCAKANRYQEAENFFKQEYAMNQAIFHFQKPYIAFLDGITMGGGVGLSIHGSFAIATERLIWAMPETRIGFFPDVGVGYHLAKLPPHIANYLALTGERIKAGDAYQLGLVNAVIPSTELADLEKALITTHFKSFEFGVVKQLITQFHRGLNEHSITLAENAKQIKQCFTQHSLEEIINNLTQIDDPWHQATAKTLAAQSPLSLKITFEHLQHCHHLNFEQVMAENTRLSQHFLRGHDFMEGVRAAVIDKDNRPQWRPATLVEVTPEMVQEYFI